MTALVLLAARGLGAARLIAAVSFVVLLAAGSLLHRRLGARARAEEAEALLDAEFARLDTAEADCESERRHESSSVP